MNIQQDIYHSVYTPRNCIGHILYIHGGPGNNSALFETFVKESAAYQRSLYGWIFYDQRGCGRSTIPLDSELSHKVNVSDLNQMISFSKTHLTSNLVAIAGHSYGARLVHDVMIEHSPSVLPIMLGLASSFKTARKKSLIMDLLNLKFNQRKEYEGSIESIGQYGEEIWKNAKHIRSKMNHLDQRKLFYWGNLDALEVVEAIKKKLEVLETNEGTFSIVRKDLHSDARNYLGPYPDKLNSKYLWINGLHDFLMAGELLDYEDKGIKTFFKSGHYPHIEEPENFLEILGPFIDGENE